MNDFNGILDIGQAEDHVMIKKIARWNGIVSRLKGKLIKMIKNADGSFDDYSISPVIRQILFHWGYELVDEDLS